MITHLPESIQHLLTWISSLLAFDASKKDWSCGESSGRQYVYEVAHAEILAGNLRRVTARVIGVCPSITTGDMRSHK